MNTRFKKIRKEAGLTQAEFGKALGVKGNYIYIMESGTSELTNNMIANVCRVFGIREEWLRTGEGEMYILNGQAARAIEWANAVLADEQNAFQRRFLEALSRLDSEGWDMVERFIDDISGKAKGSSGEPPEP